MGSRRPGGWHGGSQPPNLWFAEAHAVGLGIELELALIEAAIAKLPDLPAGVSLSVNASPLAAMTAGFARLIRANGQARRLVLELTEHAEVADYDELSAALAPLRKLGMRVAIDDAGAGFASLSHIRHLEPDIIKIDLSLTRDIDTDEVRQALAESLARFAARIGPRMVAEGVETPAEAQALGRVGIRYGQGYLFGRPADIAPQARLGKSSSGRSTVSPPKGGWIRPPRPLTTVGSGPPRHGMRTESRDWGLRHGNGRLVATEDANLGDVEFEAGDDRAAARRYADALEGFVAIGSLEELPSLVPGIAASMGRAGRDEAAARLVGVASALGDSILAGEVGDPADRWTPALVAAEARLGPTQWASARSEGAAIPFEEAVRYTVEVARAILDP